MTFDEQAQVIIDNLRRLLGDPRMSGLSVRDAALKIGATDRLADRVVELWTGPDPLP